MTKLINCTINSDEYMVCTNPDCRTIYRKANGCCPKCQRSNHENKVLTPGDTAVQDYEVER